jgi:1-acyl-sn-glycerol-3-phosphate acyltransferase
MSSQYESLNYSDHKEFIEPNPWEISPVFPRPFWMKCLLVPLLCVLVPVRIISFLALYTMLAIVLKFLQLVHRNDKDKDIMMDRVCMATRFFLSLICFVMGMFVRCEYVGTKENTADKPPGWIPNIDSGLLVTNHIGIFEDLVLVKEFCCSLVAKSELRSIPIVGYVGDVLRNVWVVRADANDRNRVKRELHERAINKSKPPLCIHSEGTTTNGKCILQFRAGAFSDGSPVRPIGIKLNYKYATPAWESGSLIRHFFEACCNVYHEFTFYVFDEYIPSPSETNDPTLYARNVQVLIANKIGAYPCLKTNMYANPQLKKLASNCKKKL